ncbi:hypothetical protein IE53DRAFT_409938 [Violaceomyces palustris]|uniref:Uncharacterized protein n=1 Tax=Violaceomyces palustris TaxID=1673888 RepID=A0ACD0P159_9BASI|nr:hypothetical protein IE53DRAFT_409938 [Violaceomyces palustris]
MSRQARPAPDEDGKGKRTGSRSRSSSSSGWMSRRLVASLGMFIIDVFQYIDPLTGEDLGDRGRGEQIGGGGCYFAIGARMWLPPSSIQMIIDSGPDFSDLVQSTLDNFNLTPCYLPDSNRTDPSESRDAEGTHAEGSMWCFRSRKDTTTRAINIYKGENRGFEYLTPKIRLDPVDLLQGGCRTRGGVGGLDNGKLPAYIHMVCSPSRAMEIIDQVERIQGLDDSDVSNSKGRHARVKMVWEPIPDSAIHSNLEQTLMVMKRIEVFSPNHEEAACLLGLKEDLEGILSEPFEDASSSGEVVQGKAETRKDWILDKLGLGFLRLLEERDGSQGHQGPIVCIRSGAYGSVIGRRGLGMEWVQAWHQDDELCDGRTPSSLDPSRSNRYVVDVTGAGNSFLGGLTAHLAQTDPDLEFDVKDGSKAYEGEPKFQQAQDEMQRLIMAAKKGSVSALLEQLGLPNFEVEGGEEKWNGHRASKRLEMIL